MTTQHIKYSFYFKYFFPFKYFLFIKCVKIFSSPPVRVWILGVEAVCAHRAEAGAGAGLRVVRVQPRVQRQLTHFLVWKIFIKWAKIIWNFSCWLLFSISRKCSDPGNRDCLIKFWVEVCLRFSLRTKTNICHFRNVLLAILTIQPTNQPTLDFQSKKRGNVVKIPLLHFDCGHEFLIHDQKRKTSSLLHSRLPLAHSHTQPF